MHIITALVYILWSFFLDKTKNVMFFDRSRSKLSARDNMLQHLKPIHTLRKNMCGEFRPSYPLFSDVFLHKAGGVKFIDEMDEYHWK